MNPALLFLSEDCERLFIKRLLEYIDSQEDAAYSIPSFSLQSGHYFMLGYPRSHSVVSWASTLLMVNGSESRICTDYEYRDRISYSMDIWLKRIDSQENLFCSLSAIKVCLSLCVSKVVTFMLSTACPTIIDIIVNVTISHSRDAKIFPLVSKEFITFYMKLIVLFITFSVLWY